MWEFISKLSMEKGAAIFCVIMGNLLGPFWFLFQFYARIFEHYDLVRLLLICLCIGIPITVFHFVVMALSGLWKTVFGKVSKSFAEEVYFLLSIASFVTFVVLLSPCLVGYFGDQAKPIQGVILCDIGGLSGFLISLKLLKKREANASSSSTTAAPAPPRSQP
jgi:hypothetical protein